MLDVFKIQISFDKKMALIYNKDSSSYGEFPCDKDLLNLMDGKLKGFFYCENHQDGKPIQIIEKAPWQDW